MSWDDGQTDRLTSMHGHNRLTDNNKTTNEEDDEIVVADVVVVAAVVIVFVVVEIVVVEKNFFTVHAHCRNVIVVMAPVLPGRPLMCSLVGG